MGSLVSLLTKHPDVANAVGATASALAAALALLVSVISLVVSVLTLRIQRRHNVLSVKPFPGVRLADYVNVLTVEVRNHGSGPMIIQNLWVGDGKTSKDCIIDWMPPLPDARPWNTFIRALYSRPLLPGDKLVLLELAQFEGEDVRKFVQSRDIVRAALSKLAVRVDYTDVYGSKFPEYTQSLKSFGRHVSDT